MMLAVSYVTLGGTAFRSKAIYCYDWLDLLGTVKVGENRRIPQQPGRAVRPRYQDETRAGLAFRIQGRWNLNNTPYTGSSVAHTYQLWATLDGLAQVNVPQPCTVTIDSTTVFSTSLIVEALDPPVPANGTPDIVTVLMDVTLPGGPITTTGS
jgi:hypothetical protein